MAETREDQIKRAYEDLRTARNRTEALSLAVWYAFLAGVVTFLYMLSIIIVDAATLTITGSATGHGLCNLTVEADIISANVSQAINCSRWEIVAGDLA